MKRVVLVGHTSPMTYYRRASAHWDMTSNPMIAHYWHTQGEDVEVIQAGKIIGKFHRNGDTEY